MRPLARMTSLRLTGVVLAALTLLTACDRESVGPVASVTEVDPGPRQARRALLDNFPVLAQARQNEAVADQALQRLLTEGHPGVGLVRRELLRELYAERDWAPVFTDDGVPNDRALALLEFIAGVERHALPPERYLRPVLSTLLKREGELSHALSRLPALTLDASARATVEELLARPEVSSADHVTAAAVERLLPLRSEESGAIPELTDAWRARLLLLRAERGMRAELEAVFADIWLELAADFRDSNWVAHNPDANAAQQQRIIRENARRSFQAMAGATTRQQAVEVLQGLVPRFQQYGRLLDARQRYQEVVAQGGWPELAPTPLARGSRGAIVAQLKNRLQLEGYYTGEINESFDRELEEALKLYQETHQFETTGRTTRELWTSLNVSAQERLAQIELTIQRWRESRIGDDPYYIHVNIPDFHAEVWRDDVLERRFRIVVGNTQRECRDGRMTYVNATPIQSAMMSYVVVNPYWVVPQRIMREELLPEALNDPTFWERNGYEHVELPGGGAMVRQLPGDNNALGAVKFIFPNEHDTYMHDTPRKHYFNMPMRAFSHGCMRVQDPVGLLEHLMTNDGQWDRAQYDRTRAHGRESRWNFSTPVPVHTEYYVVRVDDEGHVHFGADVYRHDRARLDMRFEREERCTPSARRPAALSLSADGTILTRNAEGQLVDARALQEQQAAPAVLPGSAPISNTGAVPMALPGDFGP